MSSEASFNLPVLYSPPCHYLLFSLSEPASIAPFPSDAPPLVDRGQLVSGGTVVYPCAASGIPQPTVTWFYNGGDLGGGVEVGGDGSLTIAEPLVRHSGIYQCVVENRFGEARRTWLLEVREPGMYNYNMTYVVCMYV